MANASSHERTATAAVGAPEDPLSFLKLIAEASAVFIGLTFVAGWSYLASYYRTFGLNPIELDIPIPVVATMALHMLYDSVWPLPTFRSDGGSPRRGRAPLYPFASKPSLAGSGRLNSVPVLLSNSSPYPWQAHCKLGYDR
jgi:hypothetical protein